jgi:hypothetical protein
MIDRKGLWILVLLCLTMAAAAVWRLSLLPDWHRMPMMTPKGLVTKNGLVLFAPPLSLLFMLIVAFATKWLVTGPDEAIQARQRHSRLILLGTGMLMALAQTFIIGRSLGHGFGFNPEIFARAMLMASAIMLTTYGNSIPKLPRVSKRIAAFNLDPWQSARSRRLAGRLTVALGLFQIIAAMLLPVRAITPIVMVLCLAYLGAISWHVFWLKREPSVLR